MGRVNIELQDQLHRQAKAVAAMRGTTLLQYVVAAIQEKLKKEKW